jgi:hypothetical protein
MKLVYFPPLFVSRRHILLCTFFSNTIYIPPSEFVSEFHTVTNQPVNLLFSFQGWCVNMKYCDGFGGTSDVIVAIQRLLNSSLTVKSFLSNQFVAKPKQRKMQPWEVSSIPGANTRFKGRQRWRDRRRRDTEIETEKDGRTQQTETEETPR